MSSINRNDSQSATPGTAGGHESTMNEDQQPMFPTISFEEMNITLAPWVQLICSIVLTMTGIFYACQGYYSGHECHGYYVMLYLRAFFWVVTYVVHIFMKRKHNRLKLLGYHKFLRVTHRQKKAALQLVSLSNLLILTFHTIVLECFGSVINNCYVKGVSLSLFLSIWCLVECMFLTYIHITYFVKVRMFNTMRSPPDALTGSAPHEIRAQEFINQQLLMIDQMMDENRHLQDKIEEVYSVAHQISSESTHHSLAEQTLLGF